MYRIRFFGSHVGNRHVECPLAVSEAGHAELSAHSAKDDRRKLCVDVRWHVTKIGNRSVQDPCSASFKLVSAMAAPTFIPPRKCVTSSNHFVASSLRRRLGYAGDCDFWVWEGHVCAEPEGIQA